MSAPGPAEEIHDKVHAFADGELPEAEADEFRAHLAECEQCQEELDDILQLHGLNERIRAQRAAATGAPASNAQPPATRPQAPASTGAPVGRAEERRAFRPAWARRRAAALALIGSGLAASVAWLAFRGPRGATPEGERIVLAQRDTRGLEARLAHPLASGYRPYDVQRGGEVISREQVPVKALGQLEERGDLHGAAAGHILRGELADARAYLERTAASPEAQSDLAVVALAQGRLEEALTLLDAVLEAQPKHPQALWNRALVLHELKLDLSAADAFRTVAALNEPGWADEAKGRAAALETQLLERKRAWLAAWNAGIALALEGRPVPPGMVRDAPALLRNYLYQSLWSAPSAERARALLPMAKELDAIYGGDRLTRYVEQVSKRDFKKRGPLAATFGQVVTRYVQAIRAQGWPLEIPASAQPFDPAGTPAFLEAVRKSGETDLLLGALPLLGQMAAGMGDYEKAARALGDPWFLVNAELEKGKLDLSRGRLPLAESRFRAALVSCARDADYRCAQIEQSLSELYIATHRLVEAREHALAGLQQARRLNEAALQGSFLVLLGTAARFHDAFALARAYLGEYALRQGDFAPAKALLHESLATLHIFALKPAKARAELELAFKTGAPITLIGALVLADLARLDPKPDDLERLGQVLEAIRPRLRPGELALAEHIDGRARITRDRAAGQASLRKAIASAEKLPREDPDAGKARAYSYTTLRLDAGKAGTWAEALALFGEEEGFGVPDRCVLGVEVSDEQTLVVARGANGEPVGAYDARRTEPSLQVERLVPQSVLETLRGCERVEVLARNGIHGRPGLLPPELAWSYRTGKAHAPRPNAPPRQLVVSDVEAPASLNLPRLKSWDAPAEPGRVELSGAAATPSRVLAAMADATEIEINAHGLVNLGVSDASFLVLSPEADGEYALTAGRVRGAKLNGAPVVLLGACRAAESVSPSMAAPWSLPVAFVEAGARAVIASPVEIPDREAGAFFDAVLERVRSGVAPAVAVRDERARYLQRDAKSWVKTVVVFE